MKRMFGTDASRAKNKQPLSARNTTVSIRELDLVNGCLKNAGQGLGAVEVVVAGQHAEIGDNVSQLAEFVFPVIPVFVLERDAKVPINSRT